MNRVLSERLIYLTFCGVAASVFFYGILYFPRAGWNYNYGFYIGHDSFNFWAGARFAANGMVDRLADLTFYNDWLKSTFGGDFGTLDTFIFSYPPSALVFLKPFGGLSYEWFVALWSAINFAGGIAGAWLVTGRNKLITAMVAVSPAVLGNFFHGQAGTLFAAALISALYLLHRRPYAAGVLLGLVTVKPHLAVVVVFIVLATGNWRAIIAGSATMLVIIAASVVMFGTQPWVNYFTVIMHEQSVFIREMKLAYRQFFVTPYGTLRSVGLGMYAALVIQAGLSIAAIGAALAVWLRSNDLSLKVLAAGLATVIASPYLNNYDMTIVVLGLAGWMARVQSQPPELPVWLVFAIWIIPAFSVLLGAAGILITPVILAIALAAITLHAVAGAMRLPEFARTLGRRDARA